MIARKIDGSSLKTFDMVLARFLCQDSLEKIRFFKEIFLLAKTSMDVILEMFFLALSNIDIKFDAKKLTWKKYTVVKAMPTIRQIKLIDKQEFMKAALNKASKTFVLHIAALEALVSIKTLDPTREPLLATLEQGKASIDISI